jgi:hypothetical protein
MFNPYKRLLGLLPPKPLQIGTVVSVSGDVAVVQLPDGATVTVRGATTTGASVFFRDGVIEGQAPSLPVYYLEI